MATVTAVGLLVAAQRPSAASSTVLVVFTTNAEVAHGARDFRLATDGEILAAGDRVRTDATGHALITFFDGSTLELEPSTSVAVDDATPHGDGSLAIQLTQTIGRTWASVQKLTHADSKFEIRTPSSTASVRGTAFLTEVLADGETRVHTTEGAVAVTAQGTTVLVTAGLNTTVRPSRAPTDPAFTPAPPNAIRFGMHSPAHAMVVDPLGRSCGIAMPGQRVVREIPGCDVSAPGSEPETIEVPNALAGRYGAAITSIEPGGRFTFTATGVAESTVLFDHALIGDGRPGTVFASALDVAIDADGRLSAATLAPLTVLRLPTPSPALVVIAPPTSGTQGPSTTSAAPGASAVPEQPLATPPVTGAPSPTVAPTAVAAIETPTAAPQPLASPEPSPSAAPTPFSSPSPSATPSSTPSPTPIAVTASTRPESAPSLEPGPTASPAAGPSVAPSPSPSASPTAAPSPTPTPTTTHSGSPGPSRTPVPGCEPSNETPRSCDTSRTSTDRVRPSLWSTD
jgi:hypothetical protein